MPHNSIEQELLEKLNALPQSHNRLLYDIDFDEQLVEKTAKNLFGQNPFPLSPRFDQHRLTIFVAFASAMADDEYAELDSFYNRLSEIFLGNLLLDVNRQNEIRDFIEETCTEFHLRFLRNQNRLVRNTIWLHGGLPSRHWQSFFERVLVQVDDTLNNLDSLLNPPTPRTIKRFFDLCGNSARAFLNDCIEMRDALNQPDASTYSAQDFDVSESFFESFKQFNAKQTKTNPQRERLYFDNGKLRVIQLPNNESIKPTEDWYAFNSNGRYISRCQTELPKAHVVLIHHKDYLVSNNVPRCVEFELLSGSWSNYRCEWLNLSEQNTLTLEHRRDNARNKILDVVSTPLANLIGEKLMLHGRAVKLNHEAEELDVYTTLPEIKIENISDAYLSKLRLYVNSELREMTLSRTTVLAKLMSSAGVQTIQLRGAKGLEAVRFAYLPDLKLRLDKNEYRANETPILTVGKNQVLLPKEKNRAEILYQNFHLSIPIPRQAWRISDGAFSSEPLSIPADKLPSMQAASFLEAFFCTAKTSVKFCIRNGEQIVHAQPVPLNDSSCRIDLAPFRDRANVNMELDFLFQFENKTIEVLKTYQEWTPEIKISVNDNRVTFDIQGNATGFKNRELVFWNLFRLWEQPIVLPIDDGINTITHTFDHDGEYGVQARIKRSGWGKPKTDSPLDCPAIFNAEFNIGNEKFKDFLKKREEVLVDILLKKLDAPVREKEFLALIAYLHRQNDIDRVKKWVHLFLALPETIRGRFQVALYSENHLSAKDIRVIYEQMITSMANATALVTQLHLVKHVDVEFRAKPYRQGEHDGFMLMWEVKGKQTKITLTNINPNPTTKKTGRGRPRAIQNAFKSKDQRFEKTESLKFYTLIASDGDATAIATVAIAREPLIVCFQAVQLDHSRFKLIWNVLKADEVELATLGKKEKVSLSGEKEVEPSHGQKFTLSALGKYIPDEVVKIEFAKPHIELLKATLIDAGTMTAIWKTFRADTVRIEPTIGDVEPTGEITLPIKQLQSGIKLIATSKGGEANKELRLETELPDWFKNGVSVEIELEEKKSMQKLVAFCSIKADN